MLRSIRLKNNPANTSSRRKTGKIFLSVLAFMRMILLSEGGGVDEKIL